MIDLSCFENKKIFCFTLLHLDYPYLSHHIDRTYDLSTASEGAKILDLEQLKTDAVNCLTYLRTVQETPGRGRGNEILEQYALLKLHVYNQYA